MKDIITISPSATPTINTDYGHTFTIFGLNTNITSMTTNLSGVPQYGEEKWFDILDDGTARNITWGSKFASTVYWDLPLQTIPNKMTSVKARYYSGVWHAINLIIQL